MKLLSAFAGAVIAVGTAGTPHRIDLTRYFPDPGTELAQRKALLGRVDVFAGTQAAEVDSPAGVLAFVHAHETLEKELRRHDAYVYLRAEMDDANAADSAADGILGAALERIDRSGDAVLAGIGEEKLQAWIAAEPALRPFRHFLVTAASRGRHADASGVRAVDESSGPPLESLGASYKRIVAEARESMPALSREHTPAQAYAARWQPYLDRETALAALLVPIVQLQDGVARAQGFPGAPEAAYVRAGLEAAEVDGALAAIAGSSAYQRYGDIVARAAADRLGKPQQSVRAWDLDAADAYRPAPLPIERALPLVLTAERPMGSEYATQFEQLFDPAAGRFELCEDKRCDRTGFSVGFSGMQSGLFYGGYEGRTDNIRAIAHEAGHAVHRQLMNLGQPVAAYNEGPHFLFESFAIFNELLFLDHLYRTASTPAAKAHYLRAFVDDTAFQIYGSAAEVALERGIYDGVRSGAIRDAAGLDALSMETFGKYYPPCMVAPQMKAYWARNRLYFVDPLYDVNYLFAGLLAMEYFRQYEADPSGFSARYMALLGNGFDDTPQALERRFLGIDLDHVEALVRNANARIDARAAVLARLYAAAAGTTGEKR